MVFFYPFGIGMGLLMITVAVFNWESWFVDHESRFIEMLGGELGTERGGFDRYNTFLLG
jgi:hypothetical protein